MNCKSTIEAWQEAISSLDDQAFFNIVRMYLGEIKTPYNKQRLIEQLAGFIRNEKNLNTLITLLDDFDLKLITAICFINNPVRKNLTDFFHNDYSMMDILTGLSNLTERLIIYTKKDDYSDKEFYFVNPLIWDKLSPYIGIQNILKNPVIKKHSSQDDFCINPGFITAFISYLNNNGCACKADGTLVKNEQNKLELIFPGRLKALQYLMTAFINLGLVREDGKKMIPDYEKLEQFAELEPSFGYSFICAASCSRFSREGLKKEAQLFLDCIYSIPETGYSLKTIIRLAYLTGSRSDSFSEGGNSRFSQILRQARRGNDSSLDEQSGPIIERMLDSAVTLGLLSYAGTDENQEKVYVSSKVFQDKNIDSPVKPLNIDSAFTVTLMPGLTLKTLLPLTRFLNIKHFELASEYEITKNSVSKAFDFGFNADLIIQSLKALCSYELPQNLTVSVQDWYNSYTSAVIYHGYVLKVSKDNIAFVENNPKTKRYIKEKLSEGIYLLDIPVNEDASLFMASSGLNFMGKVQETVNESERIGFPLLRNGSPVLFEKALEEKTDFAGGADFIRQLKSKLGNLKLEEIQEEVLEEKIDQRIIISEDQLSLKHIRAENLEATGTNYAGKVHLIESAMNAGEKIEIIIPQNDSENEYMSLTGKTLSFTKQTNDSVMTFEVHPDRNIIKLFVSRITYVRRIRK